MTDREKAEELIELVCKALGYDIRDHQMTERISAISDVEMWLREDYVGGGQYY